MWCFSWELCRCTQNISSHYKQRIVLFYMLHVDSTVLHSPRLHKHVNMKGKKTCGPNRAGTGLAVGLRLWAHGLAVHTFVDARRRHPRFSHFHHSSALPPQPTIPIHPQRHTSPRLLDRPLEQRIQILFRRLKAYLAFPCYMPRDVWQSVLERHKMVISLEFPGSVVYGKMRCLHHIQASVYKGVGDILDPAGWYYYGGGTWSHQRNRGHNDERRVEVATYSNWNPHSWKYSTMYWTILLLPVSATAAFGDSVQ